MQVIYEWFVALLDSIKSVIHFLFWLVEGLVNLASVFTQSINIFEDVLMFFPDVIVSTLVAILGGLLVFRILGRS